MPPLDVPIVDEHIDDEVYRKALEDALVNADSSLDTCEVRRQSCVQCIDRAAEAGAIKPQQ